jgi:hypothetical protein
MRIDEIKIKMDSKLKEEECQIQQLTHYIYSLPFLFITIFVHYHFYSLSFLFNFLFVEMIFFGFYFHFLSVLSFNYTYKLLQFPDLFLNNILICLFLYYSHHFSILSNLIHFEYYVRFGCQRIYDLYVNIIDF